MNSIIASFSNHFNLAQTIFKQISKHSIPLEIHLFTTFKMKITGIIASTLLLLAPALVSALPTSENNLLAGAESCDAKRPKSGPPLVKFNDREKKMKAATAEAKKAASKCPDSKRADFTAEKNKQKRELMKSSCVNSWTSTYL